jgi:DNA invertase Pin-like site-specific DNA recombinase
MRVALYARVSTKDKDQNPETQLRQLRDHAADLDGAVLVGEFVDRASADDLRGRRRWRELLELAQHRQVNLIIVWRLDRAFRSVLDGATALGNLRSWGCGLRSLQEPWIDTTTPIGEAMFHITIAWAGLEKRTLSERTRAGMERAREEGKQMGRPRRRPLEDDPRFPKVRDLVNEGVLTRAEGARRLHVRYATFAAALERSVTNRGGLAWNMHAQET